MQESDFNANKAILTPQGVKVDFRGSYSKIGHTREKLLNSLDLLAYRKFLYCHGEITDLIFEAS